MRVGSAGRRGVEAEYTVGEEVRPKKNGSRLNGLILEFGEWNERGKKNFSFFSASLAMRKRQRFAAYRMAAGLNDV